jgi:flagellar biogenesis protein FliO
MAIGHAAHAMTTLKQVEVSGGSQVNLLFDGKIQKNQIRTEFFNDVIQISLTESAVYPAKISSINGGNLVKIFAYQYAPKLVRCRLTVKGRAEDYRDRLEFIPSGKLLTVKISDAARSPLLDSRDESRAQNPPKHTAVASAPAVQDAAVAARTGEESGLLEHVLKSSVPAEPVKAQAVGVTSSSEANPAQNLTSHGSAKSSSGIRLTGGAALPSPWKILGKLIFVVALFCGAAFAFKKYTQVSEGKNSYAGAASNKVKSGPSLFKSIGGTIEGFARSAGASIGGKNKMVEVISNHYIGPKKSISIVRIGERVLVLGIANESINLITELDDAESGIDGILGRTDVRPEARDPLPNNPLPNEAQTPPRPAPRLTAPRAPRPPSATGAPSVLDGDRGQDIAASILAASGGAAFDSQFSDLLKKTTATQSGAPATQAGGPVRSQIRSRLEGLKQL